MVCPKYLFHSFLLTYFQKESSPESPIMMRPKPVSISTIPNFTCCSTYPAPRGFWRSFWRSINDNGDESCSIVYAPTRTVLTEFHDSFNEAHSASNLAFCMLEGRVLCFTSPVSWEGRVWTSTHDQSLVFTLPSLKDDKTKGYYVGWFDFGIGNRFHKCAITSNLVSPSGGAFTYEIDNTGQFVDVYCSNPLEQCEELEGLSGKACIVTPGKHKAHSLVLHSPICETCRGTHRGLCPYQKHRSQRRSSAAKRLNVELVRVGLVAEIILRVRRDRFILVSNIAHKEIIGN